MKKNIYSIIIVFAFLGCKNPVLKKEPISMTKNDSTSQLNAFFPVTDFIGGQIKMIDSLQLPLSKSLTVNKKTTLLSITDQEFKSLALKFLYPDIGSDSLKNNYSESTIADQSIPSITFIYTTKNTQVEIQKINVFVQPDPIKNDKVSGIYIEKQFTNNDTVFNQKLYWKTDKNFQITTEKKINSETLPIEQVKVIWDPVE